MVEKVEVGDTTSSRKEVRRAERAGRAPALAGRHRKAVSVDVKAERCSPRYHETCLARESVEGSGAAVGKPCGVWLRSLMDEMMRSRISVSSRSAQAETAAA